jgi:hypothetical protein
MNGGGRESSRACARAATDGNKQASEQAGKQGRARQELKASVCERPTDERRRKAGSRGWLVRVIIFSGSTKGIFLSLGKGALRVL